MAYATMMLICEQHANLPRTTQKNMAVRPRMNAVKIQKGKSQNHTLMGVVRGLRTANN